MATNERVFRMPFAGVYPMYLQKAARKGRSSDEVDAVIHGLTGYDAAQLQAHVDANTDLQGFFAQAPAAQANAEKVTGVVCGVRVEAVEDPLMRQIRAMDKLVDELAKGKALEKILR
jgi:hypothetical protein